MRNNLGLWKNRERFNIRRCRGRFFFFEFLRFPFLRFPLLDLLILLKNNPAPLAFRIGYIIFLAAFWALLCFRLFHTPLLFYSCKEEQGLINGMILHLVFAVCCSLF